MPVAQVYKDAAKLLGWHWSAPFDGFINEAELDPYKPRGTWESYRVAFDSEDACFISGIETEQEAYKLVQEHERDQAAEVSEARRQGESDGRLGYPSDPGDFSGSAKEAYLQAWNEAVRSAAKNERKSSRRRKAA